MPAYNPPPQVLFSPVTNYYQGKAIRTQQKAAEQAIEFNDLKMEVMRDELENAPSERERAKKLAELQIENIESQIDERLAKGDRDKLKYSDEIMKPLFQAYSDEPDENKALEIFNAGLPEAISRLPKDEQEKFIEAAGSDYQFNHEEIMLAGLSRRVFEEKDNASRQRDDEIRDATAMLRRRGVANPEEEAIKVVDKLVRYTVDPSGGAMYRTDMINDITTQVDIIGEERPEEPTIPQERTLWGLAKYATGPAPTIKGEGSKISGAAGGPISEKATDARQTFAASENTVIRAFSLNPRYPIAEQNRIKENINIGPKFWDNEDLMHVRMRAVDAYLAQEEAMLEYQSTRPGIDRDQKSADENTIDGIRAFRHVLGVPKYPAPNQAHLDALRENPEMAEDFNKKFGYLPDWAK